MLFPHPNLEIEDTWIKIVDPFGIEYLDNLEQKKITTLVKSNAFKCNSKLVYILITNNLI